MANVASFVFDDPFFSILQIKQITNVKKITKDRVLLSFFESNQFPNLSQKKIEKISPKLLNKCKILSQLHFQFAFQPSNLSKLIKKQNYSPKEIELISQIALFSFISWTQFCERNGTIDFLDVDIDKLKSRKMRKYLIKYLSMITTVTTVLCVKSGTEENLQKRNDLWAYMKDTKPAVYKEVKKTALGLAMQLNDPLGRKLIVGGYKLAQKLFGFN